MPGRPRKQTTAPQGRGRPPTHQKTAVGSSTVAPSRGRPPHQKTAVGTTATAATETPVIPTPQWPFPAVAMFQPTSSTTSGTEQPGFPTPQWPFPAAPMVLRTAPETTSPRRLSPRFKKDAAAVPPALPFPTQLFNPFMMLPLISTTATATNQICLVPTTLPTTASVSAATPATTPPALAPTTIPTATVNDDDSDNDEEEIVAAAEESLAVSVPGTARKGDPNFYDELY
jgi:hypothetical protein